MHKLVDHLPQNEQVL